MKRFYCVSTKFFDSGAVKAVMYDIEADEKPQNCQIENLMCDEYHDFFDSYEEAKEFLKEAQNA